MSGDETFKIFNYRFYNKRKACMKSLIINIKLKFQKDM